MARFVNAQVPELVQPFWAALQAGEFIADAAVQAGTYAMSSAFLPGVGRDAKHIARHIASSRNGRPAGPARA